jgi:hypothetical protein
LRWRERPASRIVFVIALLVSIVTQLLPSEALAATGFASAYLRLDRMKVSTATGGLLCTTPSSAGAGTEAKVIVRFPSTYTLSTTTTDWTATTTNLPSGATAWPNITSATITVSGQNVTWDTTATGDLTSGAALYCFNFGTTTTPLTHPGSAADSEQANVETQTTGSVQINYTEIALGTIADDQIVVTAVVPPTFVFAFTGTTVDFNGNLSPTAVKESDSVTGTITTNAKSGWIAWAKDTDRNPSAQGLRSATAAYTIPTAGTVDGTPSVLTSGTEGYVLDVDTVDAASGCTAATAAEYNGTGASDGGTFSRFFQPISSCTGGSPGTANGDTITLKERVAISGATPAATDYTDTITVVAAGNF